MPAANLPKNCAIDGLANNLAGIGALSGDREASVLYIPAQSFMHCSALTFLCAWGRQQNRVGRRLLIRGDKTALNRLMHLNLHEHLGLAYRRETCPPDANPFVPLRLISNEQDMVPAGAAIYELVRQHFSNASRFLPALQWAVSEILDNTLRHADAVEPGAVYSEYFPREHRLDVAICDLGRGIYASLGETTYLYSHGHAITQAVRRGVTRSEDIGQGNGLAGVLEIVKWNRGGLQIWTGDAVYRVIAGEERGFVQIPLLPGTGVAFSLDTRTPVDLQDTWIADRGTEFSMSDAQPHPNSVERRQRAAQPDDRQASSVRGRVIDVAQECISTGMRSPAQRLRERVLREITEASLPLTLDFGAVESATSSFLDELLGRLAHQLGPEVYARKVRVAGMSELVERMANVVVRQRIEGLVNPSTDTDGGLAR